MKATAFIVSFLVVLSSPQLKAAPPDPDILVSVGGADFGVTGIAGLGAGWSLSQRFVNVKIAAELSNGGGSARGIAYLMRSVGPGTTCIQEIATTKFDVPADFQGMLTLFSNLDLPAGDYWLVFSKPRSGPFSYANWMVSNPAEVTTAGGVRYLGTLYPSGSEIEEYVPATAFDVLQNGWAYHLEVSGQAANPEPRRRVVRP